MTITALFEPLNGTVAVRVPAFSANIYPPNFGSTPATLSVILGTAVA